MNGAAEHLSFASDQRGPRRLKLPLHEGMVYPKYRYNRISSDIAVQNGSLISG